MASVVAIQALLLSNTGLPGDLVVSEIFSKHMCLRENRLTVVQSDSIRDCHFHFKKIVSFYHSLYDRRLNSYLYFLDVLDNDMCMAINGGKSLREETCDYLIENQRVTGLLKCSVPGHELPGHLFRIWTSLTFGKKMEVYEYIKTLHAI